MKPVLRLAAISALLLMPASVAAAHSGPGAVHNFGFFGAIHHILTSPGHLLPFVLAIGLGALAANRALRAQKHEQRRQDDDD